MLKQIRYIKEIITKIKIRYGIMLLTIIKNSIIYYNNRIDIVYDIVDNRFRRYNCLRDNTDNYIFSKINNVEKMNMNLIYYGYYYNTTKIGDNNIMNDKILDIENDIEWIEINDKILIEDTIFKSGKNKINFISDILLKSTENSNFRILLEYYLQKELGINDRITKIRICYDNEIYDGSGIEMIKEIKLLKT